MRLFFEFIFADLIDLDESLDRLAREDEALARVVELRFFGGLTHEEVGGLLGVTERTAKRHWRLARMWLLRDLGE